MHRKEPLGPGETLPQTGKGWLRLPGNNAASAVFRCCVPSASDWLFSTSRWHRSRGVGSPRAHRCVHSDKTSDISTALDVHRVVLRDASRGQRDAVQLLAKLR